MLKQIDNVELSPLILGDLAYSLENWLMNPTLIMVISALMNPDSTLHLAEVGLLLKMGLVV